jgi:hypothetical protein
MVGGEWLALRSVALPLGEGDRRTHWTGELVGFRDGLDVVTMR